jgi:uncharacterized protein YggE
MFQKTGVKLTILLVALATLLIACTATGVERAADTVAPTGGITVVGRGEAFGQPDEAYVQVGVDTFAEAVTDATAENETTIQAIMAALQEQGIAPEDIQTSNYSLWAEQIYGERGPEGIAGYRVSNQVRVVIRDIDKVSDVLTAVTEAGANNIYGVNFSVADPDALEAEAREAAIVNARERAESLATLSDLTLGDIVLISEIIGQPTYSRIEGLGGGGYAPVAETAVSVSPGQLSYHVEVQVTFAIK